MVDSLALSFVFFFFSFICFRVEVLDVHLGMFSVTMSLITATSDRQFDRTGPCGRGIRGEVKVSLSMGFCRNLAI